MHDVCPVPPDEVFHRGVVPAALQELKEGLFTLARDDPVEIRTGMQESGGVEADLRTAEQDERLRGHTAQSLSQFPHELYIPEIAGEGDDGRAVFIDRLPEGLELVVDGQLQDGGLPVPAPQIGGQGANRPARCGQTLR